jgi:hypothetical protein
MRDTEPARNFGKSAVSDNATLSSRFLSARLILNRYRSSRPIAVAISLSISEEVVRFGLGPRDPVLRSGSPVALTMAVISAVELQTLSPA